MPKASRVAVPWDPSNPGKQLKIKVLHAAAQRVGLTLRSLPVRGLSDIKAAFSAMAQERPDGLVILITRFRHPDTGSKCGNAPDS